MGHGSVQRIAPVLDFFVDNYGAAGDGTANDAAAIQRCIDAAGVSGVVRFTPKKTYKINSGISFPYNSQVVLAYGAQITVNFAGVGVTLGRANDGGETTRNIQWRGGRIIRSSNDFTAGNVGLRCLNLAHSSVFDTKIFGFEKGLELLGDGQGTQYNTFVPAEVGYCKYGIYMVARNSGWVNSNWFGGSGRIGYYSNQPSSTGGYAIYLDREVTSVNILNHNVFLGLSLENAMASNKPTGAIRANCQDCVFDNLRYEGFDTPKINCDFDDCEGNSFDGGTEILEPGVDFTLRSDNPSSQLIWIRHRNSLFFAGGGESEVMLRLKNAGDTTDTVLSILQSTGIERHALRADGYHIQRTAGNAGAGQGAIFTGTGTNDFGTINANAAKTYDIQPAGLGGAGTNASLGRPGDPVTVGASPHVAGIIYSGQVTADFSTVRVTAYNYTGAPIAVGSVTLKVKVDQFTIN